MEYATPESFVLCRKSRGPNFDTENVSIRRNIDTRLLGSLDVAKSIGGRTNPQHTEQVAATSPTRKESRFGAPARIALPDGEFLVINAPEI
jgi:hypothetical protein